MRRQQERGGKKSKERRNRKTTLRMRNSRSSCASCILVSTSVCVFSVCVCVYLDVCVAFSVHVCGCPVSRIHTTTQIPAAVQPSFSCGFRQQGQNLYLCIWAFVCMYPLLLVRTQNEKMQPKCIYVYV